MSLFGKDLGYAVRNVRRNPGFTAIVVLALALGIGANAAIFAIVDAVLFLPLPGPHPEQLVRLYSVQEKGGPESGAISYPQFVEYRDNLRSFSALAAYRTVALEVSREGEPAERIPSAIANGSFFEVLSLQPRYGRLFSESDDGPRGSNPIAVLGERFWRRSFGGRPDAVGSLIRINGQRFTIIGIAPQQLEELERAPQIWLPMSMAIQAEPMMATQIDRMTNPFFKVVARLKPGTAIQQAQLELDLVGARLGAGQTIHLWEGMESEEVTPNKATAPAGSPGEEYDWKRPWLAIIPAARGFSGEEQRLSWLLLGVAGLVLLITIVNVAVLWLARAEQEEKELAVRVALGASRWDLVRQQLSHGLVVAALAGPAGLLLASWMSALLAGSDPDGLPIPIAFASLVTSLRVGIFVILVSSFACLAFSVVPSLARRSPQISESLKRQSARQSGQRGLRTQSALVVAQIVASVVLVVGAGLLIQTMRNVARIDLGFDTEHVLSASLDFSRHGYTKTQGAAMLDPLLDRVRAVPGVAAAAIIAGSPVLWRPKNAKRWVTACDDLSIRMVSPAFFETLRIPVLYGREFTAGDAKGALGVAIVNEAAAKACWPQGEPIGQHLDHVGILVKPFEIVGVVGNVRIDEQDDVAHPQLYAPVAQFYDAYPWQFSISVLARTELSPRAILTMLASAVRSLDPDLSLYDVHTPRELLGRAYQREAFFMKLLTAFGLLAFTLAITGLYGLLAYVTTRRTREFGIRMALGAQAWDILRLVLGEGGCLALLGIMLGLGAAVAAGRLLRGLLYGTASTDFLTLAAVATLFVAAALIACYLPARRAAHVDPLAALRDE